MRDWMIEMRENLGMSREYMAKKCECSVGLLHMVEVGSSTHPNIAGRIARAYGMDVHQYNRLIPQKWRAKVLPKYKPKPKGNGISIYSYGGGV